MTRGRFLEWCAGVLGAVAAALGLRGAAQVLHPPAGLSVHMLAWRRALGPDELPADGQAAKVLVAGMPYVIRLVGNELAAFSAVCPHAGCVVDVAAAQPQFACTCHGSTFDPDTGAPQRGPATAPLPAVPVRWGRGDVVELRV